MKWCIIIKIHLKTEEKAAVLSKLKSEKKHRSLFLFIVIVAVAVFVGFQLYSMNQEIIQKQAELDEINLQLENLNVENAQLRHYSSNENRLEYIEQIARDQLDYSHSDETVYYFIPK